MLTVILALMALAVAAYAIVDQAVTIAYMREGYEATERDLGLLAQLVRGRVSRAEIETELRRAGQEPHSQPDEPSVLILNRLRVVFDARGVVREVELQ